MKKMRLEKSEITRTMYNKETKTVITTELNATDQKTTTRITYVNGNESTYKKTSGAGVEERHTYIQTLDEGKPDQFQTTTTYVNSNGDGYGETIKRYKTGKFTNGRKNLTMGEHVNITSTYETVTSLHSTSTGVDTVESSRREYFDNDKLVRAITEQDSEGDKLTIEDYEYPVSGCVIKTTRSSDHGCYKCHSTRSITIDVDKLSDPSIAETEIGKFIDKNGGYYYLSTVDTFILKGTLTYGATNPYNPFTIDANYNINNYGYCYTLTITSGEHRGSKITIYNNNGSDSIRFDCVTHSENPEDGDISDTYTWIQDDRSDVIVPTLEYIMCSLSIKTLMLDVLPKNLFEALEIKDAARTEVLSGASAWKHTTTLYFPNAEIKTTKYYVATDSEEEDKAETPETERAPKAPNKTDGKVSVRRTSLKNELNKRGKITVYEPDYISEYDLNMMTSTRRERN